MENIIEPVDRKILESELTQDRFLRKTNAADNDIFMIDAHNAPNVMLEIGRLREITFRAAGGGTGKSVDIDEFDTCDIPFKQLIVWNDKDKEIISSYRFILGRDVPLDENGYPHTPCSKLFRFSQTFIENQWQKSIELGRSFVQPKYQATNDSRLGLFSLDNMWDGLGTLVVDYPDQEYFFGKMTMYNSYNRVARNMILNFLEKRFKGDASLVTPFNPTQKSEKPLKEMFTGGTLAEDFKILNQNILDIKTTIPPLIKAYMSLSSTMQYFGASANEEFGEVEEIAILLTIKDIYEKKINRHINTYEKRK
ncbi:MAG: GNAT family N-acetyltransferase [Bacteroidales bacterium]|nr:GNAT family N-acetyltransferase [Bacteroidales bacterium]